MKNNWSAHGKLLITGEYLVMEGANALAVPLKLGQSLTVHQTESRLLAWRANAPGGLWFETVFKLPSLDILQTSDHEMAEQLKLLLQNTINLSDHFLKGKKGFSVTTNLDFNPQYGFGSSSTLVYNIAQWAGVDPFVLQWKTFGGSGSDIACAGAKGPVTYRKIGDEPEVHSVNFRPPFRDRLYFVYLGKKQKTADSVRDFRKNAVYSSTDIKQVSIITDKLLKTENLKDFEELLQLHEQIMSKILGMPTVRSRYFQEYEGTVKSLGAWGGDFVLVTGTASKPEFKRQMNKLGFTVIYPFTDLVLG